MGSSGGRSPPTKVEDSVQAIRYYIGEKSVKSSGEFVDVLTGDIVPY